MTDDHTIDERTTDDRSEIERWTRRGAVPLADLPGHRMAADEPDVRGWDVVAPGGEPVGRVHDLLVDRASREVAAVVVDLTVREADGRSRVVLPIERVSLDERRRAMVAEDAVVSDRTPPNVLEDREVRRPRIGDVGALPDDAAPAGVSVQRSGDEEIVRVPIVEERLVVERRPVVTEVVTIRKRLVRGEDRVVEADLRKERVEVDRTDEGRR